MSDEPEGIVPQVSFTLDELRAIERILWVYTLYVQRYTESSQNTQRVHALQQIQKRLSTQLVLGHIRDVQLFLNLAELEAVLQAMLEFAKLLKRLFPRTEQRDAAIESVNMWRLRIIDEVHICS